MFSVIIPLYNKEHTIANTLTTVLKQTYSEYEIIIVNDGSTDNSVNIIKQNFNDTRIRIINQSNAGVSAARNRGIQEAKGKWISFLDADDEWLPTYLETVSKVTDDCDEDLIILTGRFQQNFKTKVRSCNIPIKYQNKISEIRFFENPHVFVHISATTIKASVLQKNFKQWGSFIEGQKSNEDFTFLFKVALHIKTIYIGKPLSIYNGGVENQATSTLKKQKKLDDFILFQNNVINEYFKISLRNIVFERFMRYQFRHIILQLLREKNYNTITYISSHLSIKSSKMLLPWFDKYIFLHKHCSTISILYIYLTKVIWRSYNYPVVK